jgi:YD repeat-containing protein
VRQLRIFSLAACVLLAASSFAQLHPNQDRGFAPDKMYSFTDLDHVNTFNGNLMVTLPLGQKYEVSPNLSYSFSAVYNSNLWEVFFFGDEGHESAVGPTRRANAGMGWSVSLGRFLSHRDNSSGVGDGNYTFISPDGTEHTLYFEFPLPQDPADSKWSSYDGSYIRLVGQGRDALVQMPDGTKYLFDDIHDDGIKYRLSAIFDRFGNWVNVQYPSEPGYSEVWRVTDSRGREQKLYFKDAINTSFEQKLLDRIEFATFAGRKATWKFNYSYRYIQRPPHIKDDPTLIRVAMLREILQPTPDGTSHPNSTRFSFVAPGASGFDPDPYYDTSGLSTGLIRGMQLPTKGWFEWDFGDLVFPQDPDTRSLGPGYTIGVQARRQLDRDRVPLGEWKYIHKWGCGGVPCQSPSHWAACYPDAPKQLVTMIQNPDATTLVRYYSIYYHPDCWESPSVDWNNNEYASPFTSFSRDPENRRLSWELRTGVDPNHPSVYNTGPIGTGTVLRTYYTHYHQIYSLGGVSDTKRREQSSRTVFNDDLHCGPNGNEACFKSMSRFDFIDEFGLYRQQSEGGNFPGMKFRTAFTNYDGTLNTAEDWVLGTYSEQCVAEEDTTRIPDSVYKYKDVVPVAKCSDLSNAATAKFKFNRATGFLEARRTLLGTALNARDLLLTAEVDTKGNTKFERYFGGDAEDQALSESENAMFDPPAAPEYEIEHFYTYSGLTLTKRQSQYTGATFFIRDEDLDANTGLVSKSRDAAGVEVTFFYDALSRLGGVTSQTANGKATSGYIYTDATDSTNAIASELTTGANGDVITAGSYEYDGLGRLKRTSRQLPDGKVSVVQTDYDGQSRKSRESQPTAYETHPWNKNVVGNWTSYFYDPFGRPSVIQSPDRTSVSYQYSGVRETVRNSSIATSITGSSTATTKETFDVQGRLVAVEEHSGDTRIDRPKGDAVSTSYTYDVRGNLTGVSTGTQNRTFEYDGRGFLTRETGPEAGDTTYGKYDARGHALEKTHAGTTLTYVYDAAERVTHVKKANGEDLKTFDFATANDGDDKRKGKLITAVRRNELSSAGVIDVTESYKYEFPNGQMSKRTTHVERVDGGTRTTLQKFDYDVTAYDDFNAPRTFKMPVCLAGACGTDEALKSVTNTRTAGYLTSVDGFGTMTYHPTGMVKSVEHATTAQARDLYDTVFDLPRPSRITFQGCTNTRPYFLPGFVLPKVDPNACGVQITWPAATLCGGVSSNKYRVLRDGVDISGCLTGTKFVDRSAVKGQTYTYKVVAEGPEVDGGAGICQQGNTVELSAKPFEFKSCDPATLLTVEDVRASLGIPVRFTATLGSANGPLQDELLTFSVLGNVIGSARTAANGVAVLDRAVDDYDPQLYPDGIKVTYAGGLFPSAEATADLTAVCDGISYTVAPLSINVLPIGGSFPVLVVTSKRCSWQPNPASGAFFGVTPPTQQSGTGTFTISVPDAQGAGHRASNVKVVNKFVIVEQGSGCTFRFDPDIAYLPYKSSFTTQMTVSAPEGCAWNVTSSESWVDLVQSSGVGDGHIVFRIHENSGKQRTATLRINDGTETATVNQYAPPVVKCPVLVEDLTGPGSVQNGQFVSLRAHVEGTYLEYEWWINGRPSGKCMDDSCASKNLAPGNDGYPPPGQSRTYQLVVSNSCDIVVTREVTVFNQGEACRVPVITDSLFRDFTPFDQNSPFPNFEVRLSVVGLNFSNQGNLTYQWYHGFADDRGSKVADELGGKTDEIRVRPGNTSFYWVEVSNNCGSNISRTAAVVITDPPRRRRRAVGKDFTNDGKADLPWQNKVTGETEIWAMNGTTPSGTTVKLPDSTIGSQLQSIGDIDDNERPDLIFRDPVSGQNQVWTMSGTRVTGVEQLESRPDGRWSIGGVADLDNDYNDDIIWHNNATGENEIWFQQGTDHDGTWKLPSSPGPGWGLHGADDFNRDERPDLFFHDRTTGQNSIWFMNDAEPGFEVGTNSTDPALPPVRRLEATMQQVETMEDTNWMPAMVADMDGNGYPDIVWRNLVTGENKVWTMVGATVQQKIDLPARPDPNWQIGGGGSTNAGNPGGGPDPRTATSMSITATPAELGTASAVTATLTAGGNPLAQRQVAFTLNGSESVRLLTDSAGTATAAVSVAGIAAGTYPNALAVKFDGDTLYASSTASASLVVKGPAPDVTWTNPAPIVYGTPLSAAQLNATATVAGSFVYNPPAGAVLNAGYQTLTVTFTPTDSSIAPITKNAVLFVNKAASSVTWAKPASIAYGTPLSGVQFNATSTLAGTFTYEPDQGTVLPVGTGHVLRVTFEPESPNHEHSTATTTIDVTKGLQSIRWTAPAPINFPTPLGEAQLNAKVIASGSDPAGQLTYTPAAGTVLAEGVHELTVTVAETASYEAASLTVDIIVNKLTTTVQWTSPEPVNYGTPLSATQLNATATVPGTFVYTPAAGTVLDAGTHTLSVRFTPNDPGIEPVTTAVTIRILKVKPVLTWAQPAAIVYGTALSATQLNATANMAGTLAYTPVAGAILDAGTHELLASFTPSDTRNYEAAAATVMLTVTKAPQTIVWPAPAAIVYKTPLSSTQLNATVQVPGPSPAGALTYTPAAGAILQAGAGQVLTVNAAATPNYEPATKSVTIDVLKATPVLTWPQPAPIIYKTLLSSTQLNATADVPGAFVYDPPAGTLLQAGTYTLSAQFTPADTHNYNNASATATLEVQRANPVITWSKPAGIVYGTPLGAPQLNATADVPGAFTYTPAAGTILNAGDGQTLSVHFRPEDTRNYNDAEGATTVDVAKARQTLTWATPAPIVYGTPLTPLQLNATVQVVGPSPAGALTYTPAAGTVLDAGARTLTVNAAETMNYEPATASVTLQVDRAPLSLVVDAKSKLYGAPLPVLTGTLTGIQNSDPVTPSYATTATQQSPTGTYPITATLLDPNNRLFNYDVTITPSTLTINPAPLLIAANAVSKQYSDPVPQLTATFTGFVLGETPAVLGGVLSIQTTAERLSPPGTYPITIGGLTSTNYAITYAGATLTVLAEDARVQVVSPLLVSAAPSGPSTITLAATIRDISATADANGDADSGDIRKATLTFIDRATNTALCTAPIGLTVESDERVGIAMCTFTRDFGTALPASLVVGSRVGGHYTRDAAAEDVTLSVTAPTEDHITAAGTIAIASPSGPHAPDAASKPRFEFNQRYDKKGIVQGRLVMNFTRMVNGVEREYELSAVAISSMAIQRTAAGGIAALVGTGTLRDVTVKSSAIVIAEAAPLVVTATDGGQPASNDALSFTLYKPAGGLWMATGWDGIRAVEQPLQQGAVGVHPGGGK